MISANMQLEPSLLKEVSPRTTNEIPIIPLLRLRMVYRLREVHSPNAREPKSSDNEVKTPGMPRYPPVGGKGD